MLKSEGVKNVKDGSGRYWVWKPSPLSCVSRYPVQLAEEHVKEKVVARLQELPKD